MRCALPHHTGLVRIAQRVEGRSCRVQAVPHIPMGHQENQNRNATMPKRTYPKDAMQIEQAADLEEIVKDSRGSSQLSQGNSW